MHDSEISICDLLKLSRRFLCFLFSFFSLFSFLLFCNEHCAWLLVCYQSGVTANCPTLGLVIWFRLFCCGPFWAMWWYLTREGILIQLHLFLLFWRYENSFPRNYIKSSIDTTEWERSQCCRIGSNWIIHIISRAVSVTSVFVFVKPF